MSIFYLPLLNVVAVNFPTDTLWAWDSFHSYPHMPNSQQENRARLQDAKKKKKEAAAANIRTRVTKKQPEKPKKESQGSKTGQKSKQQTGKSVGQAGE